MRVSPEEFDLAQEYLDIFHEVSEEAEFPEEVEEAVNLGPDWLCWVLLGIASRESRLGRALDARGKGDSGHGHGVMQIDDRSHREFCKSGKWKDLRESLIYALNNVLVPSFNYLSDFFDLLDQEYENLFWATVAAYNCGPGNVVKAISDLKHWDARTTGKDYSQDVKDRANQFYERLAEGEGP